MDSIIEVSNLSFSNSLKCVFDNLNFEIDRGDFISIVGPNGSGKSTLVRLLLGLYEGNGIKIDGKDLCRDNLADIRKIVGVVFDNPSNQFIWSNVTDDIVFGLENLGVSREEIKKKLDVIASKLEITHLLDKDISNLSGGEKQLVALAGALINEPKILILDEAFCMIDKKTKDRILDYLLLLHNTTDITIINLTHNLEEVLFCDKVMVINNQSIVSMGYTNDILRDEKLIKSNGLELPFVTDLSMNLKYYNLLDDIIPTMEDMVVKLWN